MIQKLLILAAVVAIAWYGFKYVTRIDQLRREKLDKERTDAKTGVSDTVQCPICNTYVAAKGAVNCGKSTCPY